MKINKSISSVIPTFNRELYLKNAINSCLNQTVKHEIIVCNHGGTDGTDEMVKQFNEKIKYIKKDLDYGPHHCWLEGILEAKGEYINLLFDDDWIEPSYIEECMKYFRDPQVGFVFTPAKVFDEKEKKVVNIIHDHFLPSDGIYKMSKYELNFLSNLISPTAFIMRKKDIIDALFNGKLPLAKYTYKGVGPDRFMILLCLLRYSKFGFIKDPLVVFRSHINSITVDSRSNENKKELIKKAYAEVDKYYYSLKYGKFFSFLQSNYILNIRKVLSLPFLIRKLWFKIQFLNRK